MRCPAAAEGIYGGRLCRVAVVGAGVIGLSTAVCIAESIPSCAVTVLAEHFTPDTTSDVAAGILLPHPFPETPLHKQRCWFKDTFDHLLSICNSTDAAEAGVFLLSGWQVFQETPSTKDPYWSTVVLGFHMMTDAELQRFPKYKFGQSFTTIKCECSKYLLWLEKRLKNAGGQLHTEKITGFEQLTSSYDIIVNCSGLGSRDLADDQSLYPVRGQILRVHAPWLKHFIRDGNGHTYIFPGIHSVTLGGTRQKHNWEMSVDEADSSGIFERCCELEPSLKKSQVCSKLVGLRPTRNSLRLEREFFVHGNRQVPIIHNYGHGGGGISIHWGTALEATQLVKESINWRNPTSKL
uniref:D-aspartate oxidase n=3 Tax=Erpetoichthys calabaricus TaxID=27687 RepID=A0A8C4RYU7_ERPCA